MTLEKLQIRKDEAEEALHELELGRSVVEVKDFNGEFVRYNQASRKSLRAYISQLDARIAAMKNQSNRPFRLVIS